MKYPKNPSFRHPFLVFFASLPLIKLLSCSPSWPCDSFGTEKTPFVIGCDVDVTDFDTVAIEERRDMVSVSNCGFCVSLGVSIIISRRVRSLLSDLCVGGDTVVVALVGQSCVEKTFCGPGKRLLSPGPGPSLRFCMAAAASAAFSNSRKFVELSLVVREDAVLLLVVPWTDS